ncbi:hypothetical protein [Parapedobacter sp. DT-150]|uniref:hypothetical protein n=1 Tax=Parapedobacter sp. DT-150 TaxID=3396162 RepID=UPI003F1A5EA5
MVTDHQHKYRKFILEALVELEETVDGLNLIIFNLAMNGEWKEIDELFAEGDTLFTKFEDLRSVSDTNVKQLLSVVDELGITFESIKNLNAVTRKEINRFIIDSADDLPY